MNKFSIKNVFSVGVAATILVGCNDVSYVQQESPANPYKDYRKTSAAVLGIGDPVSKKQMRANATMRLVGKATLENAMNKVADTYNLAIRWGDGVRKHVNSDLVVSELTFDEVRNYLEDVYKVQIVREGKRRLLVLPSVSEAKIKEFAPGVNVSLGQVVRGLAKQCDYNLVITENKDKLSNVMVTTSLKDINCVDAFDAILAPHGMGLVDEGEFYTVGGLPNRQWVLNLYEPQREEQQKVSYASEFTPGGGESDESSGGTVSGGSGSTTVTNKRDLWGELETDLTSLIDKSCENYQTVASGGTSSSSYLPPPSSEGSIAETETSSAPERTEVSAEAGSFECGYVRINRAVGLVQMRAPYTVLEEAAEVIRKVEDIASRRLLVEARILAVAKTRGMEQGATLGTSLASEVNGNGNRNILGTGFTSDINSLTQSVSGKLIEMSSSTGGGFLAASSNSLEAMVKLTESFGTTYQLMQPTIEVMDRQKAILIDGRNERYFIREAENETNDSGVITSRKVTVDERVQFVGIQFSVTSQIADYGEPHTVALQIPITEISRFVNITQIFDGETFTDAIPVATTRVIDQKVRIRDGEIKVIGGLTRTIAVDRESGVPLIRGIPMAGKLFNEEDIDYEDVEFIVLLQVKRIY